jgi:hypothetical protein
MSKTPVRQLTEYFSTPLSAVLQGSENDVNLQSAFYNVAAFLFISVGLGAAVAAYFVLEAFIKPLLWAVLCGAFLYPFKKTLSTFVCTWLRSLSDCNTPLVMGVALLPFQILNEVSAIVGFFIFDHIWELISLTLTSFGLYLLYLYQPFYEIFMIINGMGMFVYQALDYFSNPVWVRKEHEQSLFFVKYMCYVNVAVYYAVSFSSLKSCKNGNLCNTRLGASLSSPCIIYC